MCKIISIYLQALFKTKAATLFVLRVVFFGHFLFQIIHIIQYMYLVICVIWLF